MLVDRVDVPPTKAVGRNAEMLSKRVGKMAVAGKIVIEGNRCDGVIAVKQSFDGRSNTKMGQKIVDRMTG